MYCHFLCAHVLLGLGHTLSIFSLILLLLSQHTVSTFHFLITRMLCISTCYNASPKTKFINPTQPKILSLEPIIQWWGYHFIKT
jgi:hypothetical protein